VVVRETLLDGFTEDVLLSKALIAVPPTLPEVVVVLVPLTKLFIAVAIYL